MKPLHGKYIGTPDETIAKSNTVARMEARKEIEEDITEDLSFDDDSDYWDLAEQNDLFFNEHNPETITVEITPKELHDETLRKDLQSI